ncbi:hypothetical protein G7046_g3334 [Stylonectria norvegica]|nr:hypothetical protein G7046_g3334 [Stylonectria norvegica]
MSPRPSRARIPQALDRSRSSWVMGLAILRFLVRPRPWLMHLLPLVNASAWVRLGQPSLAWTELNISRNQFGTTSAPPAESPPLQSPPLPRRYCLDSSITNPISSAGDRYVLGYLNTTDAVSPRYAAPGLDPSPATPPPRDPRARTDPEQTPSKRAPTGPKALGPLSGRPLSTSLQRPPPSPVSVPGTSCSSLPSSFVVSRPRPRRIIARNIPSLARDLILAVLVLFSDLKGLAPIVDCSPPLFSCLAHRPPSAWTTVVAVAVPATTTSANNHHDHHHRAQLSTATQPGHNRQNLQNLIMSSLPPDPYQILGVAKDAQIPEIRSAYRKLVLKCHPDKVQDPTLKALKQDEFQKVQQAYELLGDDNERQRYDDQVKLAELRAKQKANISAARAAPSKYEVRTAEPRSSTYKTSSSTPPNGGKVYTTYSRSYEDDVGRGPRNFFEADIRTVRREASYDKPSKREVERERERERERDRDRERERELNARDREKDRDRERRRREDALRRAEKEAKEAKEARRQDKKQREKEREKERRRDTDDKKKHSKPYIESYDDEPPVMKPEKKKSSSKKHDEKRERSSHREEMPIPTSAMHPPLPEGPYTNHYDFAAQYIEASRQKTSAGIRPAAYPAMRHMQPPAAPTPPPAPGLSSPFPVPADDDDTRRSSARPRRGSSGEKSFRKPSKEVLEDPIIVNTSPSSRHAAQSFSKSASTTPIHTGSPPRRELPRQSTMPAESSYTRPAPPIARSQTFTGAYETTDPRGRSRSRLQPQIMEETDSEDDYAAVEAARREQRKHRSSKKHRSPEPEQQRPSYVTRQYSVDGNRAKPLASSPKGYTRNFTAEPDPYAYYAGHQSHSGMRDGGASRPSMPMRDGVYSQSASAAPHNFKVKTSKMYDANDIAYSHYPGYADGRVYA